MLNYTYRKSSCKWGKVSPDFPTFLFQKKKKIATSFSFLFCQQKARTVLNSDRRHMPQAFKGHLASSCPSEPKAFSGIRNTSVVFTFLRQEGIYFLPCIKAPFRGCCILSFLQSIHWVFSRQYHLKWQPISNIAESWTGGLIEKK